MVSATVFQSRLVYSTLSIRGKIWSRIKRIVDADRAGMGISPTSRSVKAQFPRRTAGSSSERDNAAALVAALAKLIA
jgi:hypothetical protein